MGRASFIPCIALVATAAAHAAPLACPAGTRAGEEVDDTKQRLEFCEDTSTGLKEGPARGYDAQGKMLMELTFEAGQQMTTVFTAAGARRLIDDLNAATRMQGMPWQIVVVDDHTLRYEITLDPPDGVRPEGDEATIREDLKTTPPVCMLLRLPGAGFDTMQVRYRFTNGDKWLELELRREECPAPD